MKTFIIDMDNVIADTFAHFLEEYRRETGIQLKRESLLGVPEVSGFPEPERFHRYVHTPGFFRHAPLMPHSQEALEKLNNRHKVFIVSAALEFPLSLNEKIDWLGEHFPFITWRQIIFCGSKSPITGDYMIDDYPRNLATFPGQKLLFTAPHNALLEGFERVDSWKEFMEQYLD